MTKSISKAENIGKFLDKRTLFELVFNGYKLFFLNYLLSKLDVIHYDNVEKILIYMVVD